MELTENKKYTHEDDSDNRNDDLNNKNSFDEIKSTGHILRLANEKEGKLTDNCDQETCKNLRFGIDFILKDNDTVNKNLPLTAHNTESENEINDKDDEFSDVDSELNGENDCESNDIITSSSLSVFGLHPQLSVLIRSHHGAPLGTDLRLFPAALQMGGVGLQWSSVNDVRKDRFGCK